jgi:hypothetical protein
MSLLRSAGSALGGLPLKGRDARLEGLYPVMVFLVYGADELPGLVPELRARLVELPAPLLRELLRYGQGVRRGHLALLDEFIEAGLDLVLGHDGRAETCEESFFERIDHCGEAYARKRRRANDTSSRRRACGCLVGFLVRLPKDREELLGAAALVALHVP